MAAQGATLSTPRELGDEIAQAMENKNFFLLEKFFSKIQQEIDAIKQAEIHVVGRSDLDNKHQSLPTGTFVFEASNVFDAYYPNSVRNMNFAAIRYETLFLFFKCFSSLESKRYPRLHQPC